MTNQVKLHVGYIGKTREGKRVELTVRDPVYNTFKGKEDIWYFENGRHMFSGGYGRYDIIGPWTEDKPEYETGVWYGWNGGECPVHPETVIKARSLSGNTALMKALHANWEFGGSFRIVTPYVEPEPKLECWALLDDDGDLLLCQTKEYAIASKKSWGGTIHRMIEADEQ